MIRVRIALRPLDIEPDWLEVVCADVEATPIPSPPAWHFEFEGVEHWNRAGRAGDGKLTHFASQLVLEFETCEFPEAAVS